MLRLFLIIACLTSGCATSKPDVKLLLPQVCKIMGKPLPEKPPRIIYCPDGYYIANIISLHANPVVGAYKVGGEGYCAGAHVFGDILISEKDAHVWVMAHELAHYMGADEAEARRVASYFK